MDSFTHLHLHTEYSILDGAIKISDLVKRAKEYGMSAVSITDHGNLGGVVEFYKQCKAAGVHPILGIEAYITENPDDYEGEKARDNFHAVLLAKDIIGYTRLLELSSKAALHNFYYKPRIYKQNLSYLGGHCILTSACLAGIVCNKVDILLDEQGRATSIIPKPDLQTDIDFYRSIFGEDFYLELQYWDDGTGIQLKYNEFLLEFGRKHGLPFVITTDAHYLNPEDYELHELLMAMQLKTTLSKYREEGKMKYGPYFYFASSEEMYDRAKRCGCVEAYDNTNLIANKCNVELKLKDWKLPVYPIEQEADYKEFKKYQQRRKERVRAGV